MKSTRFVILTTALVLLSLIVSFFPSPVFAEPGATFTVNASTDVVDALPGDGICETATGNGMCTLRAAIMEANAHIGPDSINLPAATYHLTIPGAGEDASATGDLDITESLTIIGDANGGTIIDAAGLGDRVIEIIYGTFQVSISYVTIQNGVAELYGGGIFTRARLDLRDVNLIENHTTGAGGGIAALAPLTMVNGKIDGNSASEGGGLSVFSDFRITNAIIRYNTANYGGALFYNGNEGLILNTNFQVNVASLSGGAIYARMTGLTLKDSIIIYSDATYGGGIFVTEGASLTLSRVKFLNNDGASYGGGIQISGGTVIGQDVLFDHNTSVDGFGGAVSNILGSMNFDRSVFSNNEGDYGGAISNSDAAFITNSTIISNTASLYGGGAYNNGNLNLKGVTVNNNISTDGAGIFSLDLLTLSNSTVSENRAGSEGGGIYNLDTVFINSATIALNYASTTETTGFGGGIYNELGVSITMRNSILFGNHHLRGFLSFNDDCYGTVNTQHYNLVGTLTNCTLANSQGLDLIGENPQLGPLADNGGPTQTHALLDDSPAIDAANPNGCFDQLGTTLTKDQRGYLRYWDGNGDGVARCDIGAYEYASRLLFFLPVTLK